MENKFIVFCFHLAVINAVTEILAKRHVKYVRLAGDVPPDLRAVSIVFSCFVICGTFNTGGLHVFSFPINY